MDVRAISETSIGVQMTLNQLKIASSAMTMNVTLLFTHQLIVSCAIPALKVDVSQLKITLNCVQDTAVKVVQQFSTQFRTLLLLEDACMSCLPSTRTLAWLTTHTA